MNVSRGKCSSRFPVKQKKTTRLGGGGKSPPKPQKGTPRRSGGLHPCPNDARFSPSLLFLAFSARVVLVRLRHAKRHPKIRCLCVVDRNHTNSNPFYRFSEKWFCAVVDLPEKL